MRLMQGMLALAAVTGMAMSAAMPLNAVAQQGGSTAPTIAPGTLVTPAAALEEMLTPFEKSVLGVAEAMPADKYSFAPKPGIFIPGQNAAYETVLTFTGELTHLAQANYFFFSAATGMKPDTDVRAIGNLKSKDELITALKASFVFAHKAVATITPANAFEQIKPVDGQSSRTTLAAFAVAHGYDHYGQLVEYLRMNGVVPPGSKK